MNRGYIKIWRKLEDSGLLQMHSTFALFVHMLMKASYKPCRVGMVELERGQLVTGRFKLAESIGVSDRQVRTCLEKLHKLQIVTSKSTSHFTVYTIVNYNEYQDSDTSTDQPTDQQPTSNRPTSDQPATTIQEAKHLSIKEVKNINTYTPPIPDELLNEWKKVRKAKKSSEVTERVFKGIEREAKLAGISAECAIEICCEKSWASFDSSWYGKNSKGSGYLTADQQRMKNMDAAVNSFLGESDSEVIDV